MKYELTVIVPGTLEEKEATDRLAAVRELITRHGGTVEAERNWGRRSLAYEIARQSHGFYATFEYSATGATVDQVERDLRLGGQVMRFLTVQAYRNPYTPDEGPQLTDEARSAEELLRRSSGTAAPKKSRKTATASATTDPDSQKKLDEALGKLLGDEEQAQEESAEKE